MKLKKVYKTLAVTIALSVTAPSGFTMDHNEKHTAHVHAAGLESGDAETSETTGLATAAETETAAQEPVSSEPATEPNTGTSEPGHRQHGACHRSVRYGARQRARHRARYRQQRTDYRTGDQ